MRSAFEIGNETIRPGEQRLVNIPLPGLHSDTTVAMPVHVIHGKREGPVLFVSAAIHGDEINGTEVIRRLLSLSALKRIKGTLLAVPVVNVFGFNAHSRYLPDRRDLNRSFPGQEKGSLAGRLAHIFTREVVSKSDIGIDLHTAAIHRDNFPQIRADLKDVKLKTLARTFAAPVLLHSAAPEGALRAAASNLGVSVMVYEAGEALRFDEISIRVAVRGIINVMREMDMWPQRRSKAEPKPSALLRSSSWVRAAQSGILRAQVKLGDMVNKGDVLGLISDPASSNEISVKAHADGVIIGRTNLPLVYEGEALFHIGRSQQTSLLEEYIDALDDNDLTPAELVEEPVIV